MHAVISGQLAIVSCYFHHFARVSLLNYCNKKEIHYKDGHKNANAQVVVNNWNWKGTPNEDRWRVDLASAEQNPNNVVGRRKQC